MTIESTGVDDHRPTSPISDVESHTTGVPLESGTPVVTSSRMSHTQQFQDLQPKPGGSTRLRRHRTSVEASEFDSASNVHGYSSPFLPLSEPRSISPDSRTSAWRTKESISMPPRAVSPLSSAGTPPPGRPHSRTVYSPTPVRTPLPMHSVLTHEDPFGDEAIPRRATNTPSPPVPERPTPFPTRTVSPSATPHTPVPDMFHDDDDAHAHAHARRPPGFDRPPMQYAHTSSPDRWDTQSPTSSTSNNAHWSDNTHWSDDDDRTPLNPGFGNPGIQPPRMPGMNRGRDPRSSRNRPWQNITQGGFSIGSMLAETFINALQSFMQTILKWSESLVSLTRH